MEDKYKDNDRKEHVIKLETKMTLGIEKSEFDLEKRRAAIKAALHSATASLAATASSLAGQVARFEGDGGAPPWGEVIIEPVWPEKNPEFGQILAHSAELRFWR